MEMKEHLIETFQFNDQANRRILKKVNELSEKEKCIRFFSHLINSMKKWMARVKQDPHANDLSWWDPVYDLKDLEREWAGCLQLWLQYIESKSEQDLFAELRFQGQDGAVWASTLKDIALQLNYHSIHHRAHIQMQIREQGIDPDFLDYIGTAWRRVE